MYNGAFVACPDPIDFRAYTTINLYEDKNAFAEQGEAVSGRAAGACATTWARSFATQRDENYMELVLGDHGRSGGQYDIWQAVFGPQGPDGYPAADLRQGDRRHRPDRSPPTGASTTT